MSHCNACNKPTGLLVKACNCPNGFVHLDCGASKSFCRNCGLNYSIEIKNIIKSAKFQLGICMNMMGSLPPELKSLVIIMFEQQILKQERKKTRARYTLQQNIIRTITEKKLYDAFDSHATKSFIRDYRLKKIKLSECLL